MSEEREDWPVIEWPKTICPKCGGKAVWRDTGGLGEWQCVAEYDCWIGCGWRTECTE